MPDEDEHDAGRQHDHQQRRKQDGVLDLAHGSVDFRQGLPAGKLPCLIEQSDRPGGEDGLVCGDFPCVRGARHAAHASVSAGQAHRAGGSDAGVEGLRQGWQIDLYGEDAEPAAVYIGQRLDHIGPRRGTGVREIRKGDDAGALGGERRPGCSGKRRGQGAGRNGIPFAPVADAVAHRAAFIDQQQVREMFFGDDRAEPRVILLARQSQRGTRFRLFADQIVEGAKGALEACVLHHDMGIGGEARGIVLQGGGALFHDGGKLGLRAVPQGRRGNRDGNEGRCAGKRYGKRRDHDGNLNAQGFHGLGMHHGDPGDSASCLSPRNAK